MGKRRLGRTRRPLPGGIDPSAFVDTRETRKAERKNGQLCREIRDALSIALATLDDRALSGVWVAEVQPGIDASHVRVIVVAPQTQSAEAYEALKRAATRLRSEVANAIHRKRTPNLSFEVHAEEEP